MTKRECAIVTAYTGVSMLAGEDLKELYKYVEELAGRPVYTHELCEVCSEFETDIENDFIKLCKEATD